MHFGGTEQLSVKVHTLGAAMVLLPCLLHIATKVLTQQLGRFKPQSAAGQAV